eukprot:515553-Amorphochlora_amoeboformis.AAC.1
MSTTCTIPGLVQSRCLFLQLLTSFPERCTLRAWCICHIFRSHAGRRATVVRRPHRRQPQPAGSQFSLSAFYAFYACASIGEYVFCAICGAWSTGLGVGLD